MSQCIERLSLPDKNILKIANMLQKKITPTTSVIAGFVFALITCLASSVFAPFCLAQNQELEPNFVYQQERLEKDIEDTKAALLGQLEEYKQVERRYNIAVNQYRSLKTLESIKDAVKAAKEAMLSRHQVLTTYLNLLHLKLLNSQGIEVEKKQKALDWIERDLKELSAFADEVEPVNDRVQINNLADEFMPLASQVQETAAYTRSILEIGKLQAVYDQAAVLSEQIKEKQATTSSELVIARNRPALKETDRLMADINELLKEQWLELENVKQRRDNAFRNFYRGISEDLDPIYSRLAQLISYFQELLKNDQ